MSLSREEMARAKFTFSIYDFEGCNKIDAFQLGNALRALGLCPSLKRISNLGGTIQRGEKMFDVEEFLAIYQDAKQDKQEGGTLEDYLEALSTHDKDRTGKISIKTLGHLLQSYGEEKLDRLEVEEVIADCGQPDEDDDQIDYKYFLKNLMKGPEIKIPMAMLRATEDGDDSGFEFSRRNSTNDNPKEKESLLESASKHSTKSQEGATSNEGFAGPLSSENDENMASNTFQESPSKSRKLGKGQEEIDREAGTLPSGSSISASDILSGKPLTTSAPPGNPESIVDNDDSNVAKSSGSGDDLSGARNLLKSKSGKSKPAGSNPEEAKKKGKKKEEVPEVKVKFQQPLISLKTEGLFGKSK